MKEKNSSELWTRKYFLKKKKKITEFAFFFFFQYSVFDQDSIDLPIRIQLWMIRFDFLMFDQTDDQIYSS